jgi:hypothetical protein
MFTLYDSLSCLDSGAFAVATLEWLSRSRGPTVARDNNIVAKQRASNEFEMHLAGVRVRVRFYGVIGVRNGGRHATCCSEDSDGNAAGAIQQRLQDGP